ncbi:hypothetical protein BDZ91DRAFT_798308 [Kalaharituber pfeilii]|nr:hypothetical protein BDZ91DRAFT_798308 [Kalaharituber pfeilii]
MRFTSILFIFAASLSTTASAADADWTLVEAYIGCFKSAGDFTKASQEQYQSRGLCRDKCKSLNKKYSATTDKDLCYCGNTLPAESQQVSNSHCNQGCAGFPSDPCGSSDGDFTIYMTNPEGKDPRLYNESKAPKDDEGDGEDTQSSTTTQPAGVTVTREGTVFVTATASDAADDSNDDGGSSGINKAGAAAGAVVGVLLAVAIGVGAFLFIRKQRRKKVEEDYRRSVAVREFAKKPETDLRLDPVMIQRRMSDGSIADNQDYSRRILKVTNPDGN